MLILSPSGHFDLQTHYSVVMKVNSNTSLTSPQSHKVSRPVWAVPPPPGGSVSTHSTSQWTSHRCRWPWGVFSTPCTPGGQSEVQNYQRQEGHGQRHVPHLLPSPGERGWQEGEKGQGAETLLLGWSEYLVETSIRYRKCTFYKYGYCQNEMCWYLFSNKL